MGLVNLYNSFIGTLIPKRVKKVVRFKPKSCRTGQIYTNTQISSGEALSGLEANPVIIEMVSLTMSPNVDAALCDTIEGVQS